MCRVGRLYSNIFLLHCFSEFSFPYFFFFLSFSFAFLYLTPINPTSHFLVPCRVLFLLSSTLPFTPFDHKYWVSSN